MIQMTDTDTGMEVHAESEADAVKAMREAKRKAAAEEKRKGAARDVARLRAREVGWHAYYLKHSGQSQPWTIKQEKNVKTRIDESGRTHVHVERPEGSADIHLSYGNKVVGVVWDGGGYDAIVLLQYQHDKAVAYAVGVADGEYCLERLPGITLEDYRRDE